MKIIGAVGFMAVLFFGPASAQSPSDQLENLAAVLASEHVCGFNVNRDMVKIAVMAFFGDPVAVAPGGRHWPEMELNMERIEVLTRSESGRRSFCRNVETNLSAFFD